MIKFIKKLGQNFLINKKIFLKIYKFIKNKYFIEVGTGLGFCLDLLNYKYGFYIEIYKIYFNFIKKKKFFFINLNIFYLNFYIFKVKFTKFFLIGNLPYRISYIILIYLINFKKIFKKFFFICQYFILNKKYNLIKYFFIYKNILLLKNFNFYPKPKINSILIKFINLKLSLINYENIFFFKNFIKNRYKIKKNLNYFVKLYFYFKKKNIYYYNVI